MFLGIAGVRHYLDVDSVRCDVSMYSFFVFQSYTRTLKSQTISGARVCGADERDRAA